MRSGRRRMRPVLLQGRMQPDIRHRGKRGREDQHRDAREILIRGKPTMSARNTGEISTLHSSSGGRRRMGQIGPGFLQQALGVGATGPRDRHRREPGGDVQLRKREQRGAYCSAGLIFILLFYGFRLEAPSSSRSQRRRLPFSALSSPFSSRSAGPWQRRSCIDPVPQVR